MVDNNVEIGRRLPEVWSPTTEPQARGHRRFEDYACIAGGLVLAAGACLNSSAGENLLSANHILSMTVGLVSVASFVAGIVPVLTRAEQDIS